MATIDVGDGKFNVWADQDFADIYLGADIARATPWALLNDDAKGRALVSAARLIARLDWAAGSPPDYATAPAAIAEANAILAADMAADPTLAATQGRESDIARVKAGSAEVEFRRVDAAQTSAPLPSEAWALIMGTGLLGATMAGTDAPFYSGGQFQSRFPPDCGYGYGQWPDETDWMQ